MPGPEVIKLFENILRRKRAQFRSLSINVIYTLCLVVSHLNFIFSIKTVYELLNYYARVLIHNVLAVLLQSNFKNNLHS